MRRRSVWNNAEKSNLGRAVCRAWISSWPLHVFLGTLFSLCDMYVCLCLCFCLFISILAIVLTSYLMHIIDIGTDTDLVDTSATCGGYTAGTSYMSCHLSEALFKNKAD